MKLTRASLVVIFAIGLGGVGVGCWGEDSAQLKTGQPAASCPGFSTDVDKLINADPGLVKLNHYIDITYKTAVSLAADDAGKKAVQKEQCDWLAKANDCKDAACLKQSLQARFDVLADSNYEKSKKYLSCPEVTFMDHDADRELCMSRSMKKKKYVARGDAQCKKLFDAFSSNPASVKYVEPMVTTNDKDDPLLKPYADCSLSNYQKHLSANDGYFEFTSGRRKKAHNYRRYQLPHQGDDNRETTDWLYQENGSFGFKDDPHGYAGTYFTLIGFSTCEITSQFELTSNGNLPSSLNGIVQLNGKYFAYEGLADGYFDFYRYDLINDSFQDPTTQGPLCAFEDEYLNNPEK